MQRLQLRTFQACCVLAAASVVPAFGQGSTTTCSTAPTSITAFNVEQSVNLGLAPPTGTPGTGTPGVPNFSNPALFTTLTPNIPTLALPGLISGAQEARQQVSLNTQTNVLTIQAFTVAPGSPTPTPSGSINFGSVLYFYTVAVDRTYFTCQPVPAVVMVGRITNNFPVTPFGNAIGALAVVSLGYTTDNPPKVNNLTVLIPGLAGVYTGAGAGTLTFPTASVNPPGTASNNPVIVFTPSATQQVFQRQIMLDASKSTDPGNLQLSYVWTQVNTNIPAGISNANSATPLITFNGGKGDYVFQVVVTNSRGLTTTGQTTISYYGQ